MFVHGLGCRHKSDEREQHEGQQTRHGRMSSMKSWLGLGSHLIDRYVTVRFKWKI